MVMQLSRLVDALPGGRRVHFRDAVIHGLSDDSRKTNRGDLFVAVRGTASDGHRFVADALGRGAEAVVVEQDGCLPEGVPGLVVEDSRLAIARLSHAFYDFPGNELLSVGVTGTNGKTTTTFLVREILRAAGMKPSLIGTVGYSFGGDVYPTHQTTPGPLDLARLMNLFVTAGCRSMAMEVSSHALDQGRVAGIDYAGAIFTNLTRDHLDYHKDFETYLAAKAKLFEGLSEKAVAVLNHDAPQSKRLAALTRARVLRFGFMPGADVLGRVESMTLDGTVFTLQLGGGKYRVSAPLVGRYNVSNMMAAATLAYGVGVDAGTVVRGLEGMRGVPGRLEKVEAKRLAAELPPH